MATIAENLQTIKDSTDAIKQAIIDKGGTVSGDITTWADAISGIESGGGSSEEEITFTGTISWEDESCTVNGYLNKIPDGIWVLVAIALNDSGNMASTRFSTEALGVGPYNMVIQYDHFVSSTSTYDMPAMCLFNGGVESNASNKLIPVKFIQQTPIKFYLNDTEYNALSPMTWEQFVNSETYNPTLTDVNGTSYKAFLIKDGAVYYNLLYDGELDWQGVVYIPGGIAETSTDMIKENTQYNCD